MKAKHIISAVLVVILPFVLILGFGTLSSYLDQMAGRTYMFSYRMLSQAVTAITVVAYIFWLTFVMRIKNRKARILLAICSLAVTVFLFFSHYGYWLMPYYPKDFLTTTTLICGLANLLAAIYLLSRGRKYDES